MTNAAPRALIGASTPLARAGLRALLSGVRVVGEVASPPDLEAHVGVGHVDVLVVDADFARLLDVLPGLAPPALVVLGADEETLGVARALHAPGWALLPLDATAEELAAGVLAATAGLAALPAALADATFAETAPAARSPRDVEPLTPRERDVLTLLANGDSNKRIAAKLDISENTVKFHLAALYSKLGVSSRAAALREGVRHGLVSI